ncbi:four helix bundle protein [Candidatus Falkowbacteria bacterium RIFOXYC2_FULL_47_12]|uniref:Four helix bundle protein n=2 Tax=Candidatus Falkowiibacteriota TaxID=1752728 RepID=A0A1F5TQP6_9BACT|nr:MAG: four helix bundle protein [Candidatus Falkowbacteria bacterium RIFOXYA2_FULL_47_9]OGF40851.1 MAG: four helix bundle protein [Candidatus Falkowbacteria bacterium RIFOXYC2_FULL_47_12]
MSDYIQLGNLDVYKMAVELSRDAWRIYERLDWRDKKILGDQFIESTDSVGANIAEGYGRYHYKDRIKFYYNSRGSLLESQHWILLLYERKKISKEEFMSLLGKQKMVHSKLNSYISSCYRSITTINKSEK